MKIIPIKSPLFLLMNAIAIASSLPSCGKVSDLLDNNRNVERPSQNDQYQQVRIRYKDQSPETFGNPWSRIINVSHGSGMIADVIVEVQRYADEQFTMLGTTDKNGNIMDPNISQHSKYRIGEQIVTEWKPAKRDLILNNKTNFSVVIKNYAPLPTSPTTVINVSQLSSEPVSIEATRLRVEKNAHVSSNLQAPLTIRALEMDVMGTLAAFAEDCSDGRNAPPLKLIAETISGQGIIDWSGCKGANGANGLRGLPCKNGTNGKGGQTGGKGGSVLIETSNLGMEYSQFIAKGKEGGLGGKGGKGGQAISGFSGGGRHREHTGGTSPCRAGKRGKSGKNGAPGKTGEIKVAIKNSRAL